MTRQARIASDILLIAAFAACLCLPVADSVFHIDPGPIPDEKRALAVPPKWGWDLDRLAELPSECEAYYNDHFGFRSSLIRWHSLLAIRWLQTSPSPKVVLGRNGFLFYGGDETIGYVRGTDPFTPLELERWRATLRQRADWLAARGIPLLFVVAPNKHTIYADELPRWVNRVSPESRLDQLAAALAQDPQLRMLDLREAVYAAANRGPVYLRSDTHWNADGAFAGHQQIVRALSQWFPSVRPLPQEAFQRDVKMGPGGDLARMLALGDLIREEYVRLELRGGSSVRRAEVDPSFWRFLTFDPSMPIITEKPSPELPHAVVVRDSAADRLIPLLSEYFRRVVYLDWFDAAVIDYEKPDVVIWEVKERRLASDEVLGPSMSRYRTEAPSVAKREPRGKPPDQVGLYRSNESVFLLAGAHYVGNGALAYPADAEASSIPVAGDWDGDGTATVGLYDPEQGIFSLTNSNATGSIGLEFRFGGKSEGLVPLTGDWDGDGSTTVGLYASASGTFFLRNSLTAGTADLSFRYGAKAERVLPLAGDWDGDGITTVGLYSPVTGTFFLRNSLTEGKADITFTYGPKDPSLRAVSGDWDGDGRTTIGIYSPDSGTFFLRNHLSGGNADITIPLGRKGQSLQPIAGRWQSW